VLKGGRMKQIRVIKNQKSESREIADSCLGKGGHEERLLSD